MEMVIMAAGRARRFGGLKQLTGFGPKGQTLLEYALHDAKQVGIKKAVLVISQDHAEDFQKSIVEPWADSLPIELVEQRLEDLPVLPLDGPGPAFREKPWGTGHSLWSARRAVKDPFLVCNADDFYGRAAFEALAGNLGKADNPREFFLQGYALAATLPPAGGVSRGFCRIDEKGDLLGVEERLEVQSIDPHPQGQLVSMNFWGFSPGVFSLLEEQFLEYLTQKGNDPESEFYLPAAIQAGLERNGIRVGVLPACSTWLGVTRPEDVPQVSETLAKWHAEGIYPEDLRA